RDIWFVSILPSSCRISETLTMSQKPPPVRVTVPEMRKRFNEGNYQQRIKAHEFFRIERKISKPRPEILKDFGQTTISVGTYCFDEHGNEIVYTHHYESPDGEVLYIDKGTGIVHKDGKMDPKRIFEDGTQYHLERPEKQ